MDEREERWAQMMRSALAGDRGVYERLLREITPVLRAAAHRRFLSLGLPAAESEDVVQETLLALHLKRQTWRSTEPLGPWLWTIARNKFIDHLRRRGRRVDLPIEDFAEVIAAPQERPGTDADDVERHLARLPDRQRDVLKSVAVEGASIGEAAQALKMTQGAVRVALHRAFATLSAHLRQEKLDERD
ncbi:MAG: RNA polymerase subunit sigma [Azorhizobium sp. 32-67-21]|nr:MAG: RNA polymerase subunit sigma [Azorhizobium sp. 32-67-21]OYY13584.1 MAG: RNA polymerase subunit sigma [Rhizobiales bacterium 35-68-8]